MSEPLTQRQVEYRVYLDSQKWQAKRLVALERAGHRCQVCNSKERLDVHHRTYANIFDELPEDLTVLCRPCHDLYETAKRGSKPTTPASKPRQKPRPKSKRSKQKKNRKKPGNFAAAWRMDVLRFLSCVPGASSVDVAHRFKITREQAEGRLGVLSAEGAVRRVKTGWYAVDANGALIWKPTSPGWVSNRRAA